LKDAGIRTGGILLGFRHQIEAAEASRFPAPLNYRLFVGQDALMRKGCRRGNYRKGRLKNRDGFQTA